MNVLDYMSKTQKWFAAIIILTILVALLICWGNYSDNKTIKQDVVNTKSEVKKIQAKTIADSSAIWKAHSDLGKKVDANKNQIDSAKQKTDLIAKRVDTVREESAKTTKLAKESIYKIYNLRKRIVWLEAEQEKAKEQQKKSLQFLLNEQKINNSTNSDSLKITVDPAENMEVTDQSTSNKNVEQKQTIVKKTKRCWNCRK